MPFRGGSEAAARTAASLARLQLRADDELVVVDNSDDGVVGAFDAFLSVCERKASRARIVRATAERSSYHARNVGARVTVGEWILFIDADCVPRPDLLEAYFDVPVADDCALVGGQIAGDESQRPLIARYSRARNYLSQTEGLHGKAGSAAATANLLVRRAAFEAVGGFAEGIRSGGDVDLCWRLVAAGWRLEYRPGAVVVHRHRETLFGFLAQVARYGAGARWLDGRYPGSSPRWPLGPGLLGSGRDIASNLARRRFPEATYRAIDALGLVAHNVGYRASNRAPSRSSVARPD